MPPRTHARLLLHDTGCQPNRTALHTRLQMAQTKCRYGGHLDPVTLKFTDPAVEWKPVYLAHRWRGPW